MKVFQPSSAELDRGAWLSSRLTAQSMHNSAAVRRDALERWRRARSRALGEEAAGAVGAAGLPPHRWEKRLQPRSRRQHRQRQPTWTSALMRTIERPPRPTIRCGAVGKSPSSCAGRGSDVSPVSMVGRIPTKLDGERRRHAGTDASSQTRSTPACASWASATPSACPRA